MMFSPSCNSFSPEGKTFREEDAVGADGGIGVLLDEDRSSPEPCWRESHDHLGITCPTTECTGPPNARTPQIAYLKLQPI